MKQTTHRTTKSLALIALFCAIIVACAAVVIPIGTIPVTLLTLAAFCTWGILGGVRGTVAVAIYLVMGIVGLPVFSGFSAGLGPLLGPTGGYLVGLLAAGAVYTLVTLGPFSSLRSVLGLVAALLTDYAIGTVWFVAVAGGAASWGAALSVCVLPFLLPDALKLALAHAITVAVRRRKLI